MSTESITNFNLTLLHRLPTTHALLQAANLTVHPLVTAVTLHGSRGLAGGYRPSSDVDLSLLIDPATTAGNPPSAEQMEAVLDTTLSHWQGGIEPDLAVIFDQRQCGLKCFDLEAYDPAFCKIGGLDCFGLYKNGKGFNGFVTNAGIQVERMYPVLKIWERPRP
jgi:hypothetical protein